MAWKHESGGGQKAENDTFHVIHTLSVVFFRLSHPHVRFASSRAAMAGVSHPPLMGQSCTAKNKIHAEF